LILNIEWAINNSIRIGSAVSSKVGSRVKLACRRLTRLRVFKFITKWKRNAVPPEQDECTTTREVIEGGSSSGPPKRGPAKKDSGLADNSENVQADTGDLPDNDGSTKKTGTADESPTQKGGDAGPSKNFKGNDKGKQADLLF
jgi:hypothetical protein